MYTESFIFGQKSVLRDTVKIETIFISLAEESEVGEKVIPVWKSWMNQMRERRSWKENSVKWLIIERLSFSWFLVVVCFQMIKNWSLKAANNKQNYHRRQMKRRRETWAVEDDDDDVVNFMLQSFLMLCSIELIIMCGELITTSERWKSEMEFMAAHNIHTIKECDIRTFYHAIFNYDLVHITSQYTTKFSMAGWFVSFFSVETSCCFVTRRWC